jgi:hypothetical protein
MKLHRIGFAAFPLFLITTSLYGTPLPHTWVSATGNDTTCTGTTARPCATFEQALNLTSTGGIVSVMGPGDYGPVTITESITIDGTGGGSIGFTGGEGIYITPSAAANIVLRNLSINGSGIGSDAIFIASAGTTNIVNVVIDGCHIDGFTQIGVGLGSESPTYVSVKNTTIQGGTLGVRTFQSIGSTVFDHVSLDHVTVQGATSAGVFTRNGNMDITNSTITGSIGLNVNGLEADTNATLNVQNSMITSNTNGVCIFSGSTAVIGTSTTITDNATNIEACGGSATGMAGPPPPPKL